MTDKIEEQIKAIEEEIRKTPYDKSTERHHGILRARLSKLKEKMEASSRSTGGGSGYAIRKQGDATVVLIGPPSAGKSTLINALTNADSKVAPYAFTTLTVIPGMMKYRDTHIQILDVPGLIEGAGGGKGRGRGVLSVARGADLLVFLTDPKRLKFFDILKNELQKNGIRINKKSPQVVISKTDHGGLLIHSNIKQDIGKETIREIAWEFGIKNGEIKLKEKVTMEELIDAFAANRVYVPALFVVNKSDQITDHSKYENVLCISAENKTGIEEFKEAVWKILQFVRVYLIRPGEEPNKDNPIIMKQGENLLDVATKIGSDFALSKTGAKIWGVGARFAGQDVSLTTAVQEGMMVRFL